MSNLFTPIKGMSFNLKSRTFGIEMETSTDFKEAKKIIIPLFSAAGRRNQITRCHNISNASTDISKGKKWQIKIDSSTETEITTPKLSFSNDNDIKFLRSILNKVKRKFKVTKNDGLHVHVERRDINDEDLLIAWLLIEKSVCGMFPNNRLSGDYCIPYLKYKRRRKIKNLLELADSDKYDHYTCMAFTSIGTVEFRFHEGTFDYYEIMNWVKFCLYFVQFVRENDPSVFKELNTNSENIYTIVKLLGLPKGVQKWAINRYNKYSKKKKNKKVK